LYTNRTKLSSRTEADNAISVDKEDPRGKRLFKRKEKCYECESIDHW